jgi:hypothetical protein
MMHAVPDTRPHQRQIPHRLEEMSEELIDLSTMK